MNNVILLADVRAAKLKLALSTHARNGEAVIVETRTGPISAEKINCCEQFAEILNSFGDYSIVDYADIRSVRPAAAQTSVINARGEFVAAHEMVIATRTVSVLPFSRRARRR